MANLRLPLSYFMLALTTVAFGQSTGCQPTKPPPPTPPAAIDFSAPLPDGQVALRKISPDEYPDFSRALTSVSIDDLRKSVANGQAYFVRRGSTRRYPYLDIDRERATASVRAFAELIDSGAFSLPGDRFNRRIAEEFDVYRSVGAPSPDGRNTHKVLFTGYFTPTYDASLTHGGNYQWPLYKRPADLISDAETDTAGRRAGDVTLVPFFSRREIEGGALAGNELVWLASRWNAYVITVQGSGRLRPCPDGRIMEVGYAGNNGRDYISPGLKMVADGLIEKRDLSFDAMRRYFEIHPDAMDLYLWQNPRTVFFREDHGGPFGSLNVPVTRMASIATDKSVYPPGMVAFASAEKGARAGTLSPVDSLGRDFTGFVMDQDRGGAIRSAGRCDIYMGIGDRAEQTAGQQLNLGALYYLAVKPELVSRYRAGKFKSKE